MADRESKRQERPYSKPTLTVYGKVIELTTITAAMGTNTDNVQAGTKTGVV